jgi:hypothetical protein
VTFRPSIANPSASDAGFRSWPQDDERSIVHVRAEHPGMDEFGSEDRQADPVAARENWSAWSDWSRDEWAFRIVTVVAAVESLVLIAVGVVLSGVLGPSTGTIVVDSRPGAAEVRIDGNVAGTTPLSVTAEEGSRSVEVRHEQTSRQWTIQVARGETSRSFVQFVTPPASVAAAASVRITSEPAQALVSIDGVARGSTPLVVSNLAPGVHNVTLVGRNRRVNRTIEIADGRPQTLHVLLPAPQVGPGWVTIAAATPLRVFENGRFVGATGGEPIPLAPGDRDLELVNEEMGIRVRQRVSVQSGALTRITPVLPRGSLAINAQPWAEVWLNGERVGETPLGNLTRPIGFYDVLLRHPDYGERKARLRVTGEGTARLNVDMRPRVDVP